MTDNPRQSKRPYMALLVLLFIGVICVPGLYFFGFISIETVNMLGRYLTFAIVAVGLDLVWGYAGILSLCQAFFFCLGGYAMGMYLAHHGGPEGIVDANGWKMPACLYVVYPGGVGETEAQWTVPWFWKPFWSLPITMLLALLIPGLVALVIGFFGFRSRVRGVYFAILTQAITVAAFNFFSMNNMKFCGTNGLTRFDRFTIGNQEQIEVSFISQSALKKTEENLEELKKNWAKLVSKLSSDANATQLIKKEFAGDFILLDNTVGQLPPTVKNSNDALIEKLDSTVKVFEENETEQKVDETLDELEAALNHAIKTVKAALELYPTRLKQVHRALERHRVEQRASSTIGITNRLIRINGTRENDKNGSSPVLAGAELNISFQLAMAKGDNRPLTLALEQRGVDEQWDVYLNDQKIGNLVRDSGARVTRFPVSRDAIQISNGTTASTNKLTIRPDSANSRDEVVLGPIQLLSGDIPAVGGTLKQNGDRFLNKPKFGVNINTDYNELVIHAVPGELEDPVRLQDWATVNYRSFKVTDNSVKLFLYIITVLLLAAVYWGCRSLIQSRLGRVLVAVRDDENTLRFSGYKPYVYKLFAFVLAGMIAGLAGMLYVPQMGIINPFDMEASKSIMIVIWVAVGGRGTLAGAVLGALVVNLLYNYFTSQHDLGLLMWKADYWPFVLGGLFIGVVLWIKGGLMGLPSQLMRLIKGSGTGTASNEN